MPWSRATGAVLSLALLVGVAPAAAQVVDESDFRFWEGGSTGDGWVDPEVAWRPDDPFWEGRRGDRDDLILDWPGGRHPWPSPQPSSRGRLEAVISGVPAQVYRERSRAAVQVDSRRVVRAAQDQVVRRDGGFRRHELGSEEVAFLVLIPLSEPVFFRGPARQDGWRHGTGGSGSYGAETEYLVAAIQGRKEQIYYALPSEPYRRLDPGGDDWRYPRGTGDGNGDGQIYGNSLWYPGPGRQPSSSWSFDMAVLGVARQDRGGVEVVLGMDWTEARENRGYVDVGELPRLGGEAGRWNGDRSLGHRGSEYGDDGFRRDRRHRPSTRPLLEWTQDAQGNWLRRLRLERSGRGRQSYSSGQVGGMALSRGGLSRSVSFWSAREGDGESVSAATLVQGLRLREDGWGLDEDRGANRGREPRFHGGSQQAEVYWGIVWEWERGRRRDEPIYRPYSQGDPDYHDLLR